ncbi:InlB B-repeat-containing protein [Enterococcus hirae]|nr:InlB B-repeat-containing protein [Enterococcus hirae]
MNKKRRAAMIHLAALVLGMLTGPASVLAADAVTYEQGHYLKKSQYEEFGFDLDAVPAEFPAEQENGEEFGEPVAEDYTNPLNGWQQMKIDELYVGGGYEKDRTMKDMDYRLLENFDGDADFGRGFSGREDLLVPGLSSNDDAARIDSEQNLEAGALLIGHNVIGARLRQRSLMPNDADSIQSLMKTLGVTDAKALKTDALYLNDQRPLLLENRLESIQSKSAVTLRALEVPDKGTEYQEVSKLTVPLDTSDDGSGLRATSPDYLLDTESDVANAYVAMAQGDFDKDGKEEVAVYIPSAGFHDGPHAQDPEKNGPHIRFYALNDQDQLEEKQWNLKSTPASAASPQTRRIYLGELDKSFALMYGSTGSYKSGEKWKNNLLPSVHLQTTKIAGDDSLVISATFPRKDADPYIGKNHNNHLAIYDFVKEYAADEDGKTILPPTVEAVQIQQSYHDELVSDNRQGRMQFAATTDGDLEGDGREELIIAGYKNDDFNNQAGQIDFGSMSRSKYLLTTIQADRPLSDSAQERAVGYSSPHGQSFTTLPAYEGDLKVDEEVMPPIAMDAGVTGEDKSSLGHSLETLFISGMFYQWVETDGGTSGKLEKIKRLDELDTNGDPLIVTAYFGTTDAQQPYEQLFIKARDAQEGQHDQIYYDLWTAWQEDGAIKARKNVNDYKGKHSEEQFIATYRPIDVDLDAVYYRYKGKRYGWSKPLIHSIIPSAPYFAEVPYNEAVMPLTSFSLSSSKSSGTEGNWHVGMGLSGAYSTDVFKAIPGQMNHELSGAAQYENSYASENTSTSQVDQSFYAGKDSVYLLITPQVIYDYDFYVPQRVMTPELYTELTEEYKKRLDENGQPITEVPDDLPAENKILAGEVETYSMHESLPPQFQRLTVDEFNQAVEEIKRTDPDSQLEAIDMQRILNETYHAGDPTTYPASSTEIASIYQGKFDVFENMLEENNALYLGEKVPIQSSGSGATGGGFGKIESSSQMNGFSLSASYTLNYQKIKGEEESKWPVSFTLSAGGGAGWVSGSSEGSAISYSFPDLPTSDDAVKHYEHSVTPALFRTSQYTNVAAEDDKDTDYGHMTQEMKDLRQNNFHPYVVTYLVNDKKGKNIYNELPALLPDHFRLYGQNRDNILLTWDNPAVNENGQPLAAPRRDAAEYYYVEAKGADGWSRVQTKDKSGKQTDLKIDGEQNYAVLPKNKLTNAHQFRLRAVKMDGETPIESVPSPIVEVYNDRRLSPEITEQPQSYYDDGNHTEDIVELFSVRAENVAGHSEIFYKWEKFDEASNQWQTVSENASSVPEKLALPQAELPKETTHYRVQAANTATLESAAISHAVSYYPDQVLRPDMQFSLFSGNDPESLISATETGGDQYLIGKEQLNEKDQIRVELAVAGEHGELPRSGKVLLLDQNGKELASENAADLPEKDGKLVLEKLVHVIEGEALAIRAVFSGSAAGDAAAFAAAKTTPITLTRTLDDAARKARTFAVHYDLNGGVNHQLNPSEVGRFEKARLLAKPLKEYADFKGWQIKGTDQMVTEIPAEAEAVRGQKNEKQIQLEAVWEPHQYQISYHSDGGTLASGAATTVKAGQNFRLPQVEKSGYQFAGWFLDQNFKDTAANYALMNGPLELYAKWIPIEYTVKVVDQTGISIGPPVKYSLKDLCKGEIDLKELLGQTMTETNGKLYQTQTLAGPVEKLTTDYFGDVTVFAEKKTSGPDGGTEEKEDSPENRQEAVKEKKLPKMGETLNYWGPLGVFLILLSWFLYRRRKNKAG